MLMSLQRWLRPHPRDASLGLSFSKLFLSYRWVLVVLVLLSALQSVHFFERPFASDCLTICDCVLVHVQALSSGKIGDSTIFLPDADGQLTEASNCCFNDAPWMAHKDARLVHPDISNQVGISCQLSGSRLYPPTCLPWYHSLPFRLSEAKCQPSTHIAGGG